MNGGAQAAPCACGRRPSAEASATTWRCKEIAPARPKCAAHRARTAVLQQRLEVSVLKRGLCLLHNDLRFLFLHRRWAAPVVTGACTTQLLLCHGEGGDAKTARWPTFFASQCTVLPSYRRRRAQVHHLRGHLCLLARRSLLHLAPLSPPVVPAGTAWSSTPARELAHPFRLIGRAARRNRYRMQCSSGGLLRPISSAGSCICSPYVCRFHPCRPRSVVRAPSVRRASAASPRRFLPLPLRRGSLRRDCVLRSPPFAPDVSGMERHLHTAAERR